MLRGQGGSSYIASNVLAYRLAWPPSSRTNALSTDTLRGKHSPAFTRHTPCLPVLLHGRHPSFRPGPSRYPRSLPFLSLSRISCLPRRALSSRCASIHATSPRTHHAPTTPSSPHLVPLHPVLAQHVEPHGGGGRGRRPGPGSATAPPPALCTLRPFLPLLAVSAGVPAPAAAPRPSVRRRIGVCRADHARRYR